MSRVRKVLYGAVGTGAVVGGFFLSKILIAEDRHARVCNEKVFSVHFLI